MQPTTPTTPQTNPEPPINHTPATAPAPKSKKVLVITLIVAAVLLLAAIGIAVWLLVSKPSSVSGTVNNQSQNNGAADVKSVTFVPPTTLPASYQRRDQNSQDNTVLTSYYFDNASSCGITTGVMQLGSQYGNTPKEAITKSADAAASLGVKTTSSADGPKFTIKDADGKHSYTFNSLNLEQSVNVQGVDFTKQENVVAYAQFGNQVASIGYSCKSDSWDAKKTELEGLLQQFTVTTQR